MVLRAFGLTGQHTIGRLPVLSPYCCCYIVKSNTHSDCKVASIDAQQITDLLFHVYVIDLFKLQIKVPNQTNNQQRKSIYCEKKIEEKQAKCNYHKQDPLLL